MPLEATFGKREELFSPAEKWCPRFCLRLKTENCLALSLCISVAQSERAAASFAAIQQYKIESWQTPPSAPGKYAERISDIEWPNPPLLVVWFPLLSLNHSLYRELRMELFGKSWPWMSDGWIRASMIPGRNLLFEHWSLNWSRETKGLISSKHYVGSNTVKSRGNSSVSLRLFPLNAVIPNVEIFCWTTRSTVFN